MPTKDNDNLEQQKQDGSTTQTPSKQDANVDDKGFCITVEDAEMSRPDSGDPCDDGR